MWPVVSAHDRVGQDNDSSAQQRRHETIEPDKEQSVRCRETWLGGKPAPKQVQLWRRKTISASSRTCDLKGEANACSNKPGTKPSRRDYPVCPSTTVWIGFSAATLGARACRQGSERNQCLTAPMAASSRKRSPPGEEDACGLRE
jgi:hypothetical protein